MCCPMRDHIEGRRRVEESASPFQNGGRASQRKRSLASDTVYDSDEFTSQHQPEQGSADQRIQPGILGDYIFTKLIPLDISFVERRLHQIDFIGKGIVLLHALGQ